MGGDSSGWSLSVWLWDGKDRARQGAGTKDRKWGKGGGQSKPWAGRESGSSQDHGRVSLSVVSAALERVLTSELPVSTLSLRCVNTPPLSKDQPGLRQEGGGRQAASSMSPVGTQARPTGTFSTPPHGHFSLSSQLEGFPECRPPCLGHL